MLEQPTTCPICGVRTEIISDFSHTRLKMEVNECMSDKCKHIFCEVDGEI